MKKFFMLLTLCLFLSGCSMSKDPATAKFEKEMNDFCTTVQQIDTRMNAIEVGTDEQSLQNAETKLFTCLAELSDAFKVLSNISFPAEYAYLEAIADEASAYMTEASALYRQAYEKEYDAAKEAEADQKYAGAYKRVQIIVGVLQGKSPESLGLVQKQ